MIMIEYILTQNELTESMIMIEYILTQNELTDMYLTVKNLHDLTLSCLVSIKSSNILKQTCTFQLQVCSSMFDLLVETKH